MIISLKLSKHKKYRKMEIMVGNISGMIIKEEMENIYGRMEANIQEIFKIKKCMEME